MELWAILLVVFASVLALYLICGLLFTYAVLTRVFKREDFPKKTFLLSYGDVKDEMDRVPYSFPSKGNRLQAYLYTCQNPKGFVLYVHGLCPGHQGYLSDILSLHKRGYEVFTYDFTGTGESGGKFIRSLAQQGSDLRSCLKFLHNSEEFRGKKILLYGHSMGGYAVAKDISCSDQIAASASISGFDKPLKEMRRVTKGKGKKFACAFFEPVFWLVLSFYLGIGFDASASKAVSKSKTPVLIAHGVKDETVDFAKDSIIAKRGKIKNPNAEYVIVVDPLHDGHLSIVASTDCIHYQDEKKKAYAEFLEKYKDPEQAMDEVLVDFDPKKANAANEVLMEKIDDFYQRALKR